MSRRRRVDDRAATYREVFGHAEFRWLVGGQVLSLVGDQALRVALSVLVYQDTASAWLTALAYALTFLPWVVGGPLLASLADRMSRRRLMILCDVGRAVLVGLVALPHQPLATLFVWVMLAALLMPPFESARSALLPDMLHGDQYVVGASLWTAIDQVAQVAGFGLGGVAVATIGTSSVLALDAGTFLLSAVTLAIGLRSPYRPVDPAAAGGVATTDQRPRVRAMLADSRAGIRAVMGQRTLRLLLSIAWWGAAIVLVPEAVAAPYALDGHGGKGMTGWYMAAIPAGLVLGTLALGRLVRPANRTAFLGPLAILTCGPLIAFLGNPPPAAALLLLFFSGAAAAYNLPLQASFTLAVPSHLRGRAFAVAASGLQVAQGVGALLGGGLTDAFGPARAIGLAGLIGALVMLPVGMAAARALVTGGLTADAFAGLAEGAIATAGAGPLSAAGGVAAGGVADLTGGAEEAASY